MENIIGNITEYISKIKDWDISNFNFDPPKSSFINDDYEIINMCELTKAPNSDECYSLACDEYGKPKKLDNEQLSELKQTGSFSVKSKNYHGQKHVWKVSKFLQNGKENIIKSFHENLASCYHQIAICIPDRVHHGDSYNIYDGLSKICGGFDGIIDTIFGQKYMKKKYSDDIIKMELNNFSAKKLVDMIIKKNATQDDAEIMLESENKIVINITLKKYHQIVKQVLSYYNEFSTEWENKNCSQYSFYEIIFY
ncbi:MAG: structural ppiase-like protein [Satyrvirus sp.]|uniref:Structural ppiase-like protein n=1 Tax=Satyrvirus sp. TaxID=2487771 RepID=A0A3G5AFZ0_9VIRU|nr:MAG: structural ppiase-like protein [Satyrvirus sp.]